VPMHFARKRAKVLSGFYNAVTGLGIGGRL